jgi:hypothetical protein
MLKMSARGTCTDYLLCHFRPFCLLFGIAELLHTDVGPEYLRENAVICLTTIAIGILFLVAAVATFCVEPFFDRRIPDVG